jgi:hypothetical protein
VGFSGGTLQKKVMLAGFVAGTASVHAVLQEQLSHPQDHAFHVLDVHRLVVRSRQIQISSRDGACMSDVVRTDVAGQDFFGLVGELDQTLQVRGLELLHAEKVEGEGQAGTRAHLVDRGTLTRSRAATHAKG